VKPWKRKSSRYVLPQPLSVRADDCVTGEGVEISPYYVLEYSDWVNIVLLDGYDHVLLVRQYWHGLGRISLELPCGGAEPVNPRSTRVDASFSRRPATVMSGA
jgi:hypothetical protein